MRSAAARIALYAVVALAFAGALRFTPQLPDQDQNLAERLVTQAGTPAFKLRFDTLGRGESLHGLLTRGGLSATAASRVLQAARALDERKIPAGMPVTIKSESADSTPSEVTLQVAIDRLLHLRRDGDSWVETEEQIPWTVDTILVAGAINSTLYDAMDASVGKDLPQPARQQLAWSLADVYDYRIDMSRDLQVGDEFRVMAERMMTGSGAVRIGKILAATFKLSGTAISAVNFGGASTRSEYFDQNGKSMRAAFLRAPLEFRRISSVFGTRHHPILGEVRQHKGTDYSAAAGTPVRAIGDGVVTRAGWGNGYGNVLEIRHRNGFVTRYGHLRGYASGIRVGTRVEIGRTVAYVGSTGLSTGPHLHFEVIVDGAQRDPRIALRNTGGDPVAAQDRPAFLQLRDQMLATLDAPSPGLTKPEFR